MIDHYEAPHARADECPHAGVGKACRPCRNHFDYAPITPVERAAMRRLALTTPQTPTERAYSAHVPRLLDALDTAEADLDGFANAVSQWKRRALDAEAEVARLRATASPVRPDRETVRDEIAGYPIGSGYYSTAVGVDEAAEIADAVLDLWPGESRAQVQDEAVQEVIDFLDSQKGDADAVAFAHLAARCVQWWHDARADRNEKEK